MLGPIDWRIFTVGVAALLLGLGRLWQLRNRTATLSGKAIIVAQLSLGMLCIAYGTVGVTAPYLNVGMAFWTAVSGPLIGSLEILVLTLRTEQVPPAAVRRVLLRAGFVTAFLLATWLPAFAFTGPTDINFVRPPINPALVAHELVFHGYVIWGLSQTVVLAVQRVPQDIRRRPTYGVALLIIGIAAIGFALMNVLIPYYLFAGRNETAMNTVIAPNVVFLASFVIGSGLLAVGERVQDEIVARYRLGQLRHIWARTIELSTFDLRLATHLPAPDQLQRAYVEIMDALCTLRVETETSLTVEQAADILRQGAITDDPTAPTISEALPIRRTRQEDLTLVHTLAKSYRHRTSHAADPADL